MKNIKYFVVVAAVAVVALVLLNLRSPLEEPVLEELPSVADAETLPQETTTFSTPAPTTTVTTTTTATTARTASETQDQMNFEERMREMQNRRPELNFDPAEVEAAVARETAWAEAEEIPRHLPLKPDEFTDGRDFIQLDSLKIETLMPGDEVKIQIDDLGVEYAVSIDRVEKHDYDNISWYGHIDGPDGQIYHVSFTRGNNITFGGIETPDGGHYVIQSHGNDGWIASSGLLFKTDPDLKTDAILPSDHPDYEQEYRHHDHHNHDHHHHDHHH